MNVHKILGKNMVFSGGGFFRILPYSVIKKFSTESEYVMTYFHPRDFDANQPIIKTLPMLRKFKSYVGIRSAFRKFTRYLDDFDFVSIEQANETISWDRTDKIRF